LSLQNLPQDAFCATRRSAMDAPWQYWAVPTGSQVLVLAVLDCEELVPLLLARHCPPFFQDCPCGGEYTREVPPHRQELQCGSLSMGQKELQELLPSIWAVVVPRRPLVG